MKENNELKKKDIKPGSFVVEEVVTAIGVQDIALVRLRNGKCAVGIGIDKEGLDISTLPNYEDLIVERATLGEAFNDFQNLTAQFPTAFSRV